MKTQETEKSIEQYLVKKVKEAGGLCYKFVSPGNSGVPDRICVFPDGYVIFVEVKTIGGRISALQQVQLYKLKILGASVHVVWSKEDVDNITDRFIKMYKFKAGLL